MTIWAIKEYIYKIIVGVATDATPANKNGNCDDHRIVDADQMDGRALITPNTTTTTVVRAGGGGDADTSNECTTTSPSSSAAALGGGGAGLLVTALRACTRELETATVSSSSSTTMEPAGREEFQALWHTECIPALEFLALRYGETKLSNRKRSSVFLDAVSEWCGSRKRRKV
jgi:hypothetical protein